MLEAQAAGEPLAARRLLFIAAQAITLTGDVTRDRDVKTMLDDTIVDFGRLDRAFNNAGIAPYQVDSSGKKTAEWSDPSVSFLASQIIAGKVRSAGGVDRPQIASSSRGILHAQTARITALVIIVSQLS